MRLRFREWLDLQDRHDEIVTALREKRYEQAATDIVACLQRFCGEDYSEKEWYETVSKWYELVQENEINLDIPLFTNRRKKPDNKKEPWDYPKRTWWVWAHTFAKEYGWDLQYIANLELDHAFYLMQEILIGEQLEREWEWSKTELAYPYNSNTKKSEFVPLPRPAWMKEKPKPPKLHKIPRNFLPMGIVLQGTDDERVTAE